MIIPGAPNPLMWGQGDPIDELGKIDRAVRFNATGANSPMFSRTPLVAGDRTKWVAALWYKRGSKSSGTNSIFSSTPDDNAVNTEYFGITPDSLEFSQQSSSSYSQVKRTSGLYRDYLSHNFVVINYDSNNPVASDRVRIELNGKRLTSFSLSSDPSLGMVSYINGTFPHRIGRAQTSSNTSFDGLLSFFCFVDGKNFDSFAFGQFHPITGQWRPKSKAAIRAAVAVGGGVRNGWGTNGCFLPFDDPTSLITLGYDRSQSDTDTTGNNWTATNISLTPGATYDSMLDTPTTNYCTLNPLLGYSSAPVFSEGNLTFLGGVSAAPTVLGTIGMSSGVWAWTVKQNTSNVQIGIAKSNVNINNYLGFDANGWGYGPSGQKVTNNTGSAYGATFTNADTIGVLFNADLGTLEFFKQTNSTGPFVSQGVAFTGLTSGPYFPAAGDGATGTQEGATFDFGQRGFNPTLLSPSAKALCAKNLTFPLIPNPSQHYTVVTVTKSGDTNFTIPWDATAYDTYFEIKRRDASGDWYQIDGLRGYDKYLSSNSTAAEVTDANVLGVSGFTGTLKSTLPNGSYVISMHKAGLVSARATNTDGTITSTVSVNQISGFSIATYTGTGANGSFGHGLGRVPAMETIKSRTAVASWPVKHKALAANDYLLLNSTSGINTNATVYNGNPTSTVVNVGTDVSVNVVGVSYVAYIHAEVEGYSKFGSYTGNGSVDGPFINTNSQPMWSFVKRTDSANNWFSYNSVVNTYNVMLKYLLLDSANPEAGIAGNELDYYSNGYKFRNTNNYCNVNGGNYIYATYAQFPFRYANAR